jgi:hypothetical protein
MNMHLKEWGEKGRANSFGSGRVCGCGSGASGGTKWHQFSELAFEETSVA